MADKYLEPVNNHFEDVDDDIFLSKSRLGSINSPTNGYGMSSSNARITSTNPFENDDVPADAAVHSKEQMMYAQKRREIESRTLESTQKSLGLLYETEEVGKATAAELAKQREQLEKTSQQLDEINSTLRFSQRHLNSLKSVFGGLRNYLAGNRGEQPPNSTTTASHMTTSASGSGISTPTRDEFAKSTGGAPTATTASAPISPTERYDSHPVSRIRGDTTTQQTQLPGHRRNNAFESQLEANLDEMCSNLSNLKGLAMDLGTEIESQNELLDSMNYKIEDVDIKMNKQNKEINKMLGK